MAVYKVPQDVEAEDKLLGPFSFRQFIYLIIAALAGFAAYLLYGIFPGLMVIPLPILVAFLVLALPLRKDQPMETYILALIRFFLKPRNRIWNQDGSLTTVEIIAPTIIEQKLVKDLTQDEARSRLDYLARVMDSRGWATKGLDTAVADHFYDTVGAEASTASDIMDEHTDLAKSFDTLLAQKNEQTRQATIERMRQITQAPAAPSATPSVAPTNPPNLKFNPYPSSMHQRVIQPVSQQPAAVATPQAPAQTPAAVPQPQVSNVPPAVAPTPPQQPIPPQPSPAIISLANNNDLSISVIAHEAQRLADQEGQEVVVSLH